MPEEEVFIAPDLVITKSFEERVPAERGFAPYDMHLFCYYDPRTQKYEVLKMTVIPASLGGTISSAGMRQVRVHDAVRSLVRSNVRGADDGWRPATTPRARPQTDAEYRDAAREYVAARILGDPPLERVASAYSVSRPTATRIVAEARRRGFSTDG
ncbi:MAG: hypothetical protein WBA87_07910 [Microbacterium sp.]